MLIFNSDNKPIILDNIHGPTTADHMWVLDMVMMDYTLAPLLILEEIVCPTVQVCIKGFEFMLPAYWSILVYDQDTSQLDVIPLEEAVGKQFTALIHGANQKDVHGATIVVTNYFVEYKNVGPALNKHQMLCHPIGPDEWISISPSDSYNKYLKDMIAADLL